MAKKTVKLRNCSFEILTEGRTFVGLGEVRISGTKVRSGRLPLRPCAQSFTGLEMSELRLVGVSRSGRQVRLRLKALFTPLPVKLLRDHSFDPIHETGDWDAPRVAGEGELDLVIVPARDSFDGARFEGFSYHYEYRSRTVPLFYILDRASWELDGDITGATVVSQSSCSAPVATFKRETRWSTEGLIHWEDALSKANPVMTHNLPRWASHQAFDFQFKGDKTLIGVFERVNLIRSIIQRDPRRRELKTFDKHIFNQTLRRRTSAKSILLSTEPKTPTAQRNLWTRIFDEVHERARAEFGIREVPLVPRVQQNFWDNFVINDYRKDLLPAVKRLGFKAIFIDNINKSAATERCPHRDFHWNMCCGHEYEPAMRLGGPRMLKRFVRDCKKLGIRTFAWTNNDQALSSPVNNSERDDKGWFVRLEDTRQKFGGAYAGVMSVLDFNVEAARNYWRDCLIRTKRATGLDAYLFDSFYNLGFMPVNYARGLPSTQWRGLLTAFKQLQDKGIEFMIESFGPWGTPQHGCPVSYGLRENLFAAYKLTVGLGYTTIPTGEGPHYKGEVELIYRFFAHMASPGFPLFVPDGKGKWKRIDRAWTKAHRQALADYNDNRVHMHKRFLQEDGEAVLWHDAKGRRATLWNFAERDVRLPGAVHDLTAGKPVRGDGARHLKALHTYAITGVGRLPTQVRRASTQ